MDPGDTDGFNDVYTKDLATGDITLVSTSDGGTKGNASSFEPSPSADGTMVAFGSFATNMDPGDTDSVADVYVKELGVAPAQADLSLAKSDSPDPVLAGDLLTYTLDVSNSGPDEATGVTLTDTLPPTVEFGSASASQGPGCTEAGGTVTCDLGSIASGSSAQVTIEVTPTEEGTITNTAEVTGDEEDPNPANNSDSEDTTVEPAADLGVSVSDAPDPVAKGQNVTYSIAVTNNGESDATGVSLVDTTSKGGKVQSVTTTQGTCTLNPRTGTVNCALGSLAEDTSATVEVVAKAGPPRLSPITNTATVSGNEPDPDGSNNSDMESTMIV